MNLKKYIEELKRRNVFKVAITYGLTAWILLQIVETVAPIINAPDWLLKVVFILLIIGFPIALISAWAFEMSPKGIIRTESVESKENPLSSKKKNPFTSKLLIGVLVIVVIGQFVYNQFWSNLENNVSNIPDSQEVLNKEMNNSNLIAVLPFLNSKPDKETDYLGFAIADQIIGSLVYLNKITVRPSSSIRKYENQTIDPAVVGKALNVDYILVGNYLNEDNNIRLNIELINLKTNEIIWREPVEVKFESAFKLQDIVTKKVVRGLNLQFSDKEINRINKDIPTNSLAYDYYLRAISYPRSNKGDELGIEMIRKSLELDSLYAPSYSYLGARLHTLANYGLLNPEISLKAEHYLKKALSLNPELFSAMGNLVFIYTETDRIEEAVKLTRKMIEISPNNADAHFSLSYIYRYAGMNEEGVLETDKALLLDAKNPRYRTSMINYYYAKKYEKALSVFENFPKTAFTINQYGNTLFHMGKQKESIDYFKKAFELDPDGLSGQLSSILFNTIEGNRNDALLQLKKLEDYNLKDAEPYYYFAESYALLNDIESTIRCLKRAIDGGFFNYPLMTYDIYFDNIRENSEFKKMLELAKIKHLEFKKKLF